MTDESVRSSVTVRAPIEKAFTVFTQHMDSWWPRTHKIDEGELKQAGTHRARDYACSCPQ